MTTDAMHAPHDATAAGAPGMEPVLSIRAKVPEAAVAIFVADALHRIRLYMREHELAAAAPPFALTRPSSEPGVVDAEAGWPTAGIASAAGSIHAGTLPRSWLGSANHTW